MALRDQPYLPLYVQDFLSDEKLRECNPASVGVFIFMMCVMHKSDEYGVILLNQKGNQKSSTCLDFASKLARHLPYQIPIIEEALKDLLEHGVILMENDRILQKRMVRDFQISEIRSKAGKKGGDRSAFARNFAQPKSQPNTEYEYVYENENENEIIPKGKKRVKGGKEGTGQEQWFEQFYQAYPKKRAGEMAKKAFMKISMDEVLFYEIMESLERWKKCEEWTKDNGQFVPYPATWLNGKRWKDEIPEPSLPTKTIGRKMSEAERIMNL